eukprot:CAMPEP_0175465170 /NCGR_PEP_ID=MMETSP0095-20121207/70149_1 /TAXON_ID=311494 /ORGANISM="Alexandrium monilatum, Strain CCMP3105" /LENGTH=293 /DNA_ID=CAMNT_0016766469 /DNA_START=225 /DNA_END=1106 /DNA_ORIENTATION=-
MEKNLCTTLCGPLQQHELLAIVVPREDANIPLVVPRARLLVVAAGPETEDGHLLAPVHRVHQGLEASRRVRHDLVSDHPEVVFQEDGPVAPVPLFLHLRAHTLELLQVAMLGLLRTAIRAILAAGNVAQTRVPRARPPARLRDLRLVEEEALVFAHPLGLRHDSVVVHEADVGASAHMLHQVLQELGRELGLDVGRWRRRRHRPRRSRVDADDNVVTVNVPSQRHIEQVVRGTDNGAGLSGLHALFVASLQGGDTLGVRQADPVAEEHAGFLAVPDRPHARRPAEIHVMQLLG